MKPRTHRRHEEKLRRVVGKYAWFGGICAGIAYHYAIPVWLVRVGWVVAFLAVPPCLLIYLIIWMFMPKWERVPDDFEHITAG
jgi:phage shock protein PspC (stress-responsive transcriptional regulator)